MTDPTGRIPLSVDDIMKARIDSTPKEKRANIFPNYTDYVPHLYKALQLPSYVHGYSLAIEFMRNWFLKKFDEDYFKSVYINGSHVLDNWKNWNNYNIKREKPMLAIVPTVNYDWDRDNLDLYLGDPRVLLHRSNHDESFFKDWRNMLFMYLQTREMEMNFAFRIRVNTRAQQYDLFNRMELNFRIGATQDEYLSVDWHIPDSIVLQLAKDAYFEMDEKTGLPKDIPAFIGYLNQHSSAPIIFKMRAINQKPAFFIRARNITARIITKDKISLDDGEREGKLETNFHLDMQAILRIPVPHFYAYMAEIPIADSIQIKELKPSIGIYTINNFDIRPENVLGWPSIAVTSYAAEKGESEIDISSLFNSNQWPVAKVLHEDIKLGISPDGFLDIQVFHNSDNMGGRLVRYHMDYRTLRIVLDEEVIEDQIYDIAIYADMNYVNGRLTTEEKYEESRVEIQPEG